MVLILDSSALFAMEDLPDRECFCPPGVIDELRKYKDRRLNLWGDMLRVSDCTTFSIDKVKETAKKSGDLGRLSPTDITVIALGLELKGTVLSNDFSIQNVCAIMDIDYRSVGTDSIKKIEKWNYQCIGCGKWFKEKSDECPVCGSQMRSHRKR
ncbi:MAG: nucleic acid-binding protein [Candidatus Methanomethylophilaceae archaeon]